MDSKMEIDGSSSSKKKQAEIDLSSSIVKKPKQVSAAEHNQQWICWNVLNMGLDCGSNCACRMKLTEEWLQFELDMPGLSKEDIKISVDGPAKNIIGVEGVSGYNPDKGLYLTDVDYFREFTDVGYARFYAAEFIFPVGCYVFRIKKYETEMVNGLLKLRIPKVKDYDFSWISSKFDIYNVEKQCSKFDTYYGEAQILPKKHDYSTGNCDFLSSFFSFPFKASNTEERWKEIMDFFKFKMFHPDKSDCDKFIHLGGDWCHWEDEDKSVMWFDLPGLELTQIEITVEADNTMIIKGEGIESPADDDAKIRWYGTFFNVPPEYNLKDYKKGMKNGVLKVEIPKVKNGGQDCV